MSSAAARSRTARALRISVSAASASTWSASSSSDSCSWPVSSARSSAAQVPQRQVVEVEAPLPGTHQVGRQRGVAGETTEHPAASAQRVHRPLGFVQGLRLTGVREPVAERLLVLRGGGRGGDVGALAVCGGDRDRRHVTAVRGAGADAPTRRIARPSTRAPTASPRPHPGSSALARTSKPSSASGFGGGQRGEQPVAQHLELEVVEQRVDLLPVPRREHQLVRGVRQRDVAHHFGEFTVEQDVRQVLAQRVTDLAADLVDVVDQADEIAVLPDPLGGGLLPHPGDAGQVVARVAAQRREVGVLRRCEPVLLLDGRGGEPGEVRDALLRVQHRDAVGDQLERVAVAGHHQDAVPERLGLGGERGDHVVGLEAFLGHHRDAQRAEDVLGDLDLPLELVRSLAAIRLVLGELLGAERLPGHVERRRHVASAARRAAG